MCQLLDPIAESAQMAGWTLGVVFTGDDRCFSVAMGPDEYLRPWLTAHVPTGGRVEWLVLAGVWQQ